LNLKWRITLITIVLMAVSCLILVLSINLNVARTFTGISAVIISQSSGIVTNPDTSGGIPNTGSIVPTPEPQDAGGNQSVTVTTEGTATLVNKGIFGVRSESIYIFLIIVLLAGALAYFLSLRTMKPLTDLNKAIQQVQSDNLSSNLAVSRTPDEVRDLTLSFNQMIARLRNSFDSQKRFNGSMAHEMKTPLTVMKTNMDVLASQQDPSIADYRDTFRVLEKSVTRIDSLIDSLIEMVQQENAPLDDNIELDGLLSDVLEDAKRIAAPMGIHVNCEGQFPIIQMRGNEILLYRAISNIVENAIKYNRPDGKVLVSCQKTVGNAIIRVQDTGYGIPDEAKDAIFEPFHRIRSNQEGLGLGLSFAKSVITMHGGTIGVASVLNVGSTFMIKIPVE